MDFSDFMESDRAAKKRDPKEYARGVAADEKQAAKAHAQTAEGIAERKATKTSGGGGGGGGIPKTGLKKPLDMKKGGKVKASSASKRADGIAVKGKTRGRII